MAALSSTWEQGSTFNFVAIAKVLGIETEYGIAGGPDSDPITSSSIIVNAYAQQGRTRINWDFEGETPDMDARGRVDLTSFAPIVENAFRAPIAIASFWPATAPIEIFCEVLSRSHDSTLRCALSSVHWPRSVVTGIFGGSVACRPSVRSFAVEFSDGP